VNSGLDTRDEILSQALPMGTAVLEAGKCFPGNTIEFWLKEKFPEYLLDSRSSLSLAATKPIQKDVK